MCWAEVNFGFNRMRETRWFWSVMSVTMRKSRRSLNEVLLNGGSCRNKDASVERTVAACSGLGVCVCVCVNLTDMRTAECRWHSQSLISSYRSSQKHLCVSMVTWSDSSPDWLLSDVTEWWLPQQPDLEPCQFDWSVDQQAINQSIDLTVWSLMSRVQLGDSTGFKQRSAWMKLMRKWVVNKPMRDVMDVLLVTDSWRWWNIKV